MVSLDARGERSFGYWRDQSAAKRYFDAGTTPLEARVEELDALYLTADDHQLLHGLATPAEAVDSARALGCAEVLIKRGAAATPVRDRTADAAWTEVDVERVERVVDTAAGFGERRRVVSFIPT